MLRTYYAAFLSLLMLLGSTFGCQERMEPTVSLTQEQWKRVKNYVHAEAPKPENQVGAVFSDADGPVLELVGWDLEPNRLVTNQQFSMTLHWKSLGSTDRNWKVFVHLQPANGGAFQNLDHHPVENLYQTSQWEEGQYVEDIVKDTLKPGFPTSGADVFVGLFDERTGERLSITDPGKGEVIEDGKLKVGQTSTKNDKLLRVPRVSEPPTLDGDLSDPVWRVAARTPGFVNASDGKRVSFSTTARVLYTNEAVYFGFDVRDRDIRTTFRKRDDKLWEQDCVEIYLNPDGDDGTYWELQISPGPGAEKAAPIFDAYFETRRRPAWEISKDATLTGLTAKVQRKGTLNSPGNRQDDTSYTVEVKVPFKGLLTTPGGLKRISMPEQPPSEGSTWRVNFFRVDHNNTSGGKQTRHAAWSPSGGDFHNLDAFGILEFGELRDPNVRPTRQVPDQQAPRVQARLISHNGNVNLATVSRTLRSAEPTFLECLQADGNELPGEEKTWDFTVKLNEKAAVIGIERPSGFDIESSVVDCMAREIEGWTSLRVLPQRVRKPAQKDDQEPQPEAGKSATSAGTEKEKEGDEKAGDQEGKTADLDVQASFKFQVKFTPASSANAPDNESGQPGKSGEKGKTGMKVVPGKPLKATPKTGRPAVGRNPARAPVRRQPPSPRQPAEKQAPGEKPKTE